MGKLIKRERVKERVKERERERAREREKSREKRDLDSFRYSHGSWT